MFHHVGDSTNMEKQDLRIIKTKKKLSEACIDLMKEKPLSDIKVSELCERAGISRATFYNNFNSVDEIFTYFITCFEEPFEEIFEKQLQTMDVNEPDALSNIWKSYIFPIIEELEKRREDLNSILSKQNLTGDFYLTLVRMVSSIMKRLLSIYKTKFTIDIPDDLATSYAAGGTTALICQLLLDGDKYTLEEKQYYVFHICFELSDYYFTSHQEK